MALALVPEAVAFSLIAGLTPLVGLYAAFVMGLVTSLIGDRPGIISGRLLRHLTSSRSATTGPAKPYTCATSVLIAASC